MYCRFLIAIVPHVATLLSGELKEAGVDLVDGRGGLMFQLLDTSHRVGGPAGISLFKRCAYYSTFTRVE